MLVQAQGLSCCRVSATFEGLTAVLLNIQVVWDVTLCRWVRGFQRFERSLRLHLVGSCSPIGQVPVTQLHSETS
jgi:hypothetical protein